MKVIYLIIIILISEVLISDVLDYNTAGERNLELVASANEMPGIKDKPLSGQKISDLEAYQGRLFIGYGDLVNNVGPIPVLSYNPEDNSFDASFTADEEELFNFRIFDDTLYVPGTDPRESWDFGNLYKLPSINEKWIKLRSIPAGIHTFDVIKYKQKLFVIISGWADALIYSSADGGLSWQESIRLKGSDSDSVYCRFSNFGVAYDKLFACGWCSYKSDTCYYVYDNISWRPLDWLPCGLANFISLNDSFWLLVLYYTKLLDTQEYVKMGFLYKINKDESLENYTLFPTNEFAIVAYDVFRWEDDYNKDVLVLLLKNIYNKKYYVKTSEDFFDWNDISILPDSIIFLNIEYLNNCFYLGTGNGSIYRIKEIFKKKTESIVQDENKLEFDIYTIYDKIILKTNSSFSEKLIFELFNLKGDLEKALSINYLSKKDNYLNEFSAGMIKTGIYWGVIRNSSGILFKKKLIIIK